MKLLNKAKKSLGQNFLIDKNVINKIVKIGNIDKSKTTIEIGAGYGDLTNAISMEKPNKIFAIEKDKKLSHFLKEKFKNYKNIEIINRDILNLIEKNNFGKNIIVFGNLPYNASTKILASLILLNKWPPWYNLLVLMFQKEVAERILAKSQSKEYNRLAVLSNWRLDIQKHFDVSNNCFFPKPKVTSTVLSFRPKKNIHFNLKSPKNLEKVTRILFSNRRKMINKNLNKLFNRNKSIINKLNINLNKRPEELSSETYYRIATEYEKLLK
tara:strand:+ start:908 stop:1714 length:807 start_codon:yes stop_codon:yes gene_type:complete